MKKGGNKTELIKELLVYVCIGLVLYLFYKSILSLILLFPCIILYRKVNGQEIIRKSRQCLTAQFKDALNALSASLRAGISVENSIRESLNEMKLVHGEDSPICLWLKVIINMLNNGFTAEEAFAVFAEKTKIEDIETFSSVFSIAKRTGGNMVEIVKRTADDISEKIDTENEIQVLISSKKFEQKIMTLVPVGIIVYVDLTSGGMLDPLYGNITGVIIMTICLGIYAGAILLGSRIMNIEV